MPNEEQPKPVGLDTKSLFLEGRGWGRKFLTLVEDRFAHLLSNLPLSTATLADYQKAMTRAVFEEFRASGTNSEALAIWFEEFDRELGQGGVESSWNEEKNSRRLGLVDKSIQQTLTADETIELGRLTAELRVACRREDFSQMEALRQLHGQLLDRPPSQGS